MIEDWLKLDCSKEDSKELDTLSGISSGESCDIDEAVGNLIKTYEESSGYDNELYRMQKQIQNLSHLEIEKALNDVPEYFPIYTENRKGSA